MGNKNTGTISHMGNMNVGTKRLMSNVIQALYDS